MVTVFKNGSELAPFLERVVERYHRPEFLGTDPLAVVHRFPDAADRELGALLTSLLAYGNVKQITRSLQRLFDAMEWRPSRFVQMLHLEEARSRLSGFKHRFSDSQDVLCLCWLLSQLLKNGTLEDAFLRGYDPAEPDLVNCASRFADLLYAQEFGPYFSREHMLGKSSFKHLLPRADKGSACKRIHLFLRWVVRPSDGVDLGLWKRIPAQKLLMPVDTHILRIGRHLGLIRSQSASLCAAREITRALSRICPSDPTRYDFALCRLGILKQCPARPRAGVCGVCELCPVCTLPSRKHFSRKAE